MDTPEQEIRNGESRKIVEFLSFFFLFSNQLRNSSSKCLEKFPITIEKRNNSISFVTKENCRKKVTKTENFFANKNIRNLNKSHLRNASKMSEKNKHESSSRTKRNIQLSIFNKFSSVNIQSIWYLSCVM